jgi:hypothetical protein
MSANGTNTMTLREVALRLARLPGSLAGKIDDGKLLSLLKSGELKAGFFFPRALATLDSNFHQLLGRRQQ